MSDETREETDGVEVVFSAEQAKEVLVHFTITLSEALIREQNGAIAVVVAQRSITEAILKHASKLNGVPNNAAATTNVRSLVENARSFRKPKAAPVPPI